MPSRSTGGVMTIIIKEFIGRNGGNYVCQKEKEVWDSEIYNLSMRQC